MNSIENLIDEDISILKTSWFFHYKYCHWYQSQLEIKRNKYREEHWSSEHWLGAYFAIFADNGDVICVGLGHVSISRGEVSAYLNLSVFKLAPNPGPVSTVTLRRWETWLLSGDGWRLNTGSNLWIRSKSIEVALLNRLKNCPCHIRSWKLKFVAKFK